MQTDSLLTEADRKMLARWKEHRSLEWQQMSASTAALLAKEIERLEQENQRLWDEKSEASFLSFSNDGGPISDLATTRDALTAARDEIQRLRANAEMDQAQRAEWQKTIDKLEAENEKLSTNLRLSLILSDPVHAGLVMERISTLEGRVQGITEIVKQELAIIVERVKALESRA